MELLDGKRIADEIKAEIAAKVEAIKGKGGKIPHLVAILVGHDGASETYVGHKEKACAQVGFKSQVLRFEDSITETQLLNEIQNLNNDPDVDGFIVQMPLPEHIEEQNVI
jgi:methylenetetrahydrofolate dehydrogenase (NADP+)/methenyltetrahydrofolate cyclohydrolase